MVSSAEPGPTGGEAERAKLVVAAARRRAEASCAQSGTPRIAQESVDTGHLSSLRVRCPHCQRAISVEDDTPWSQIVCRDCGSSFSLIGSEASSAAVGTFLGRFELLERIGEGGFGTVWRARDTQLDRQVALKIPRCRELSAGQVELFLREARATAQLHHPHIVSLHEVGRDGSTLYLVSDLVEGQQLAERLHQRISVAETVDLCEKIARALHHAHTAGIVHRDLKPANILLDAQGEPHLTDFGLAKRDAGEVTMTIDGQLVGTPAYMSPEQARGRSHEADARSDVFSLGVVLFEMLTGELPFRGSPRMVVDKVLHCDAPSPRSLNAQVPRDLETICLKCLEKQPAKRYVTAAALADDLSRFRRRERIAARPAGRLRRLARWYRRHPVAANVGVIVAALAVIGPIFALQQARLVTRESQARARADRYLYVAHMNNVQDACEASDYRRAVALLNQHRSSPGREDLRSFEWYYWWEVCHRGLDAEIPVAERIHALAVSHDGQLIAFGGSDHRVTVWNRSKARPQFVLTGHAETVTGLEFSIDGRWLVSSSEDGSVRLWDVSSGQCVDSLTGFAAGVRGVAFSRDGQRLATAILDGTAHVWDLLTADAPSAEPGARFVRPARHVVRVQSSDSAAGEQSFCYSVAWNSSGTHLATGSGGPANWNRGEMQWWNLATGACEARVATARPCDCLAYSPHGDLLAFRDAHGSLAVWDPGTRTIRHRLTCPAGEVFSPTFSADGTHLAASSDRGMLWCWDVASQQIVDSWPGHAGLVYAMAYAPQDNLLVSGGIDRKLRLWRTVPQSAEVPTPKHTEGIVSLAFAPDSSRLVSGSKVGEMRIWNVADGRLVETLSGQSDWAGPLAVSPDGKTLAYRATKEVIGFWDLAERRQRAMLAPHRDPVFCVAYSPDGGLLAVGGGTSQALWPGEPTDLRLWDTATGKVRQAMLGNRRLVRCLAFSPDGQTLATGGFDRLVSLWDVATGRQRGTINTGQIFNVVCIAFSPDGRTLAFGTHDGSLWLADMPNETSLRHIPGQDGTVWAVAYSPDGRTLAAAFGQHVHSADESGTVKLFDTATSELKTSLSSKNNYVYALAFAPNGEVLAGGFSDGTLRLWRAPESSSH